MHIYLTAKKNHTYFTGLKDFYSSKGLHFRNLPSGIKTCELIFKYIFFPMELIIDIKYFNN